MKCPNCGTEMEEEKLLCENCGYEVRIVPEFDIELEDTLKESISVMMEDMAEEELKSVQDDFEEDIKESISDYFPDRPVRPHRNKKNNNIRSGSSFVYVGHRGTVESSGR